MTAGSESPTDPAPGPASDPVSEAAPDSASGPASSRGAGLRLTILGSGTLLPDRHHRSAAHLIEAGGLRCLVDCGAGTVHGFDEHGVAWQRLDAVVFSHYHTDHIGDLPALLFALKHGVRPARTEPLTLVGPPGLLTRLEAMADAFGDHVEDPGFPLRTDEIHRRGSWRFEPKERGEGGLRVDFHPTPHTEASVAQRWQFEGHVVAYTGDTGPPDADLVDFLSDADVLVAETSLPDTTDVDNHLTPGRVAELATAAEPGLLITTHVYPPLDPEGIPGMVAEAGYEGRVEAGVDGLLVEIGGQQGQAGDRAIVVRGP